MRFDAIEFFLFDTSISKPTAPPPASGEALRVEH